MNSKAHWFSIWLAIWSLATGIPEAFPGPRFLPASWALLYSWLPDGLDWIWPGLFILTGITAAIGIRSTRALIVGFDLSALAYFIWGSTSIYGWATNQGGTIPGSAAYYLLAGTMFLLAVNVQQNRRIADQVAEVQESEIHRSEGTQ